MPTILETVKASRTQLVGLRDEIRAEMKTATASTARELQKQLTFADTRIEEQDARIEELTEAERRENAAAAMRVELGLVDAPSTGATRGQWVRTNDMRSAAVLREQRFADHEIVQDYSRQVSGRESTVIGQHGSFGQMVRAMSTTTGSALVPTIWASDVIDRGVTSRPS
jgi:HK97 family phage major capsid protein